MSEREYELKARLSEPIAAFRRRLEAGRWRRVFVGEMRDRRYDTPDRRLERDDEVLRVRRYESEEGGRTILCWKGPTGTEDGYKVRDEIETAVADDARVRELLSRLGYSEMTMAIDRGIEQYERDGVTVRIEEYPGMDVLVELEAAPARIEGVVAELGVDREAWRSWELKDFVLDYERRTGMRARLSWDDAR